MSITLLGHLRALDPAAWRAKVRAAVMTHATLDDAARVLGVGGRTLRRWLTEDTELAAFERRGRGRPPVTRPGDKPKGGQKPTRVAQRTRERG